jgi:hypothetical protein
MNDFILKLNIVKLSVKYDISPYKITAFKFSPMKNKNDFLLKLNIVKLRVKYVFSPYEITAFQIKPLKKDPIFIKSFFK